MISYEEGLLATLSHRQWWHYEGCHSLIHLHPLTSYIEAVVRSGLVKEGKRLEKMEIIYFYKLFHITSHLLLGM